MYAAQHQYLTVIGDAMTGLETWQFGLRITDGGASSEATALALAPIVQNWWTGVGYTGANAFVPFNNDRLTELKVARIDVEGHYPPTEAAYSHFYLPPIAGTSPSTQGSYYPAQITTCITLRTDVPRGLAAKGRIFIPLHGGSLVDNTGRMQAVAALQIANSIKTLITNINAEPLVGNVQIMSRGKAVRVDNPAHHRWDYTYPNPGVSRNVIAVSVGRVPDTQRRRRRALLEDRQATSL